MVHTIYAEHSVSVTELKRNYASIVSEADGPIAVFNHNRPEMYLVPAEYFEKMMNMLEDMELNAIADSRKNDKLIEVSLDEL